MTDAPSERIRVRRLGERGAYDRENLGEILDEALICHVGFITDGDPYVIPTIHARTKTQSTFTDLRRAACFV